MGKLIKGVWFTDEALAAEEAKAFEQSGGKFERSDAGFRHWITRDGAAGPSGDGGFSAEAGRYHLFGALNCPWAHRTMIYRKIKGLDEIISLTLAAPARTDQGWVFLADSDRFSDPLLGLSAMHELYSRSAPDYTGRVTVPVLWDKQSNRIVSNESSEIIRMFDSEFDEMTGQSARFYPAGLKPAIDELNDYIYHNINNGVYKAGFARTQDAYDSAVTDLFSALDSIEARLQHKRYLLGDDITEADWRLLPTLLRFDVGYFSAFKCNIRAIRDYPRLSAYLQALYEYPGVADTVDFDVYRHGYHSKNPQRNPNGIVPTGFESALPVQH